ncbi:MAG: glycosyltransferase [Flavobacteriia bacterium]|nr:glycosyltransferase [Flavobacteriia bacterium]OJX34895.1 MAG: hypothetical protein BGO87_09135 [Flavobacteriia bacterium 40-80]
MSSFLIFFSLFTIIILFGQLTLKNRTTTQNELLQNLTVIIPFRNEMKQLPALLNSLKKQPSLPKSIIFINDHSEDLSVEILEDFKELTFKIIHLENEQGKKAAIKNGISFADTEYILTLDADVRLPDDYFYHLSELILKDAHILPVAIENQPFFSFFNLDYYYLFALNNGLHFLDRPFSASGGNFLFKRKLYHDFIQQDKNQDITSGDDIYFLNFLVRRNKQIVQSTEKELCVKSYIPDHFPEIIRQRIRWIKKGSSVQSFLPVIIGLTGIIYHWGFVMIMLLNLGKATELILTKIAFDCITFYPYLVKIGKRFSLLRISVFSLFYPVWMILIGLFSVLITPSWKGRRIITK